VVTFRRFLTTFWQLVSRFCQVFEGFSAFFFDNYWPFLTTFWRFLTTFWPFFEKFLNAFLHLFDIENFFFFWPIFRKIFMGNFLLTFFHQLFFRANMFIIIKFLGSSRKYGYQKAKAWRFYSRQNKTRVGFGGWNVSVSIRHRKSVPHARCRFHKGKVENYFENFLPKFDKFWNLQISFDNRRIS